MTDLETLQRGTINALREQLLQQATAPCAACAAKEQTIGLLADVVDWHRSREGAHTQSASLSAVPSGPMPEPAQWATDDEEVLAAALDYGAIDAEQAERLMAQFQAQNATLEIVK